MKLPVVSIQMHVLYYQRFVCTWVFRKGWGGESCLCAYVCVCVGRGGGGADGGGNQVEVYTNPEASRRLSQSSDYPSDQSPDRKALNVRLQHCI